MALFIIGFYILLKINVRDFNRIVIASNATKHELARIITKFNFFELWMFKELNSRSGPLAQLVKASC